MVIKESFGWIKSDRVLHFSEGLLPGASEYENIRFDRPISRIPGASDTSSVSVTGHARCKITSIVLHTATRMDFAVSFSSKDVIQKTVEEGGVGTALGQGQTQHQNLGATPYDAAFLGMVRLFGQDAIILGAAATATEYLYQAGIGTATAFAPIFYEDEDNTNALHVGLHNIDRDSKTKVSNTGRIPEGGGAANAGQATPWISLRIGYVSGA